MKYACFQKYSEKFYSLLFWALISQQIPKYR